MDAMVTSIGRLDEFNKNLIIENFEIEKLPKYCKKNGLVSFDLKNGALPERAAIHAVEVIYNKTGNIVDGREWDYCEYVGRLWTGKTFNKKFASLFKKELQSVSRAEAILTLQYTLRELYFDRIDTDHALLSWYRRNYDKNYLHHRI